MEAICSTKVDRDDQRADFRRAGGLHQRARRVAGEFAKRLAERAQRPRLAGDGDDGGHADQRAEDTDAEAGRPAEQAPADRAEFAGDELGGARPRPLHQPRARDPELADGPRIQAPHLGRGEDNEFPNQSTGTGTRGGSDPQLRLSRCAADSGLDHAPCRV